MRLRQQLVGRSVADQLGRDLFVPVKCATEWIDIVRARVKLYDQPRAKAVCRDEQRIKHRIVRRARQMKRQRIGPRVPRWYRRQEQNYRLLTRAQASWREGRGLERGAGNPDPPVGNAPID